MHDFDTFFIGAVGGKEEVEELDREPLLCRGHEAQAPVLG